MTLDQCDFGYRNELKLLMLATVPMWFYFHQAKNAWRKPHDCMCSRKGRRFRLSSHRRGSHSRHIQQRHTDDRAGRAESFALDLVCSEKKPLRTGANSGGIAALAVYESHDGRRATRHCARAGDFRFCGSACRHGVAIRSRSDLGGSRNFEKPPIVPDESSAERSLSDPHHLALARFLLSVFPSGNRGLSGSGDVAEYRLRDVKNVLADMLDGLHGRILCVNA